MGCFYRGGRRGKRGEDGEMWIVMKVRWGERVERNERRSGEGVEEGG